MIQSTAVLRNPIHISSEMLKKQQNGLNKLLDRRLKSTYFGAILVKTKGNDHYETNLIRFAFGHFGNMLGDKIFSVYENRNLRVFLGVADVWRIVSPRQGAFANSISP